MLRFYSDISLMRTIERMRTKDASRQLRHFSVTAFEETCFFSREYRRHCRALITLFAALTYSIIGYRLANRFQPFAS